MSDPLKFKKHTGTTDLGKRYEEYFPVSVILKLLQNKDVKDFRISANDDQFRKFDDFILEVDYYQNKSTDKYAVQLKHKKSLTIGNLKNSKDFGLLNYAQAFQKCDEQRTDYKVILFTNANFKDNDDLIDLGNNEESVKVRITKCEQSSVISTSKNGKCYQFQLDFENSKEIKQKYNDFFKQFFLYTNQLSTHELYNEISRSVGMLTSKHSVSTEFLKFISDWSIKDGIKDKLTKDMIIKILTLFIVEGHVYSHAFCEVNDKQKIIQKAISQFNITAFNNKSLDHVVKTWGDAKSLLRNYGGKGINEIFRQFQIGTRYITDIDDLTDEELTKLLWVMDKCPLILKDDPAAYEAATLCRKKSKFVFITDNLHYEKLQELTVFKTLSDLKRHKTTYNDIVNGFTFTPFGEEISFEQLIKEDKGFENLVTVDEIAKVADNINLIELDEEKLCFPYVGRRLYENIIDFKYLEKLDKTTTVLISNVHDVNKLKNGLQKIGLQNFEIVSMMDELHKDDINSKMQLQIGNDTLSENNKQPTKRMECDIQKFEDKLRNNTDITEDPKVNHDGLLTKHKLFFNKTETSSQEFNSLCDKQKQYQKFHHLKYHDKYFEWIEGIGDVSDLQHFSTKSDNVINENKYAENIRHNLNIVIGDPGMGKSFFVKMLKNNLRSKHLPVMILPTDVPELCQFIKHRKNLQKFYEFILKTKFPKFGNFERRILKLFMEKRKVVYLWDALDELKEDNRKFAEDLIKALSEKSVAQIVTSRGFLQKHLEDKFQVLSQKLQPFNDEEQTVYIRERLQDICDGSEEIKTITRSIKNNIAETSYNDILGIPLQIYMLTELFRQDLAKYKKMLCEFFVVTDLYFHFIEEKFNVYLEIKKKYPSSYKEDTFIENSLTRRKKNYQAVALKSMFGTAFSTEFDQESDSFLKGIKEKGDEFGIIIAVDKNMNPEFLHKSYAEYFAASYLAENCRNISNLELIFERKYTNVKYFFDLLLAKNSPAHIAVLCKNLKYLKDCSSTDELKSKDLQGRTVLHLAASWGERYPLLETSKISDDLILINDNINYETKEENPKYFQIMEVLLDNCHLNEVDELFNFTPTIYAEKCECLFAAAIIEKKIENQRYLETKNEKFIYSLLYYAIKYKFINIVKLIDNLKFVITKSRNSFLHMAVADSRDEYLKELLEHEVYRQKINYPNLVGETALMTAAKNGYTKTVEYLIQKNADVNATTNEGLTPLYLAALKGHLETVRSLKQLKAEVDATAKNSTTPLIGAAANGHLDTVKYLIQQNASVNAAANGGHTAIHLAASDGHLEIVKYLKQKKAKVDAVDDNGITPLMAAAVSGHFDIVKYLIQQNADVNAAASEGQTPLHYAALNGHLETVKYLKQKHAKVDAAAKDGTTPLMRAACNGHLDVVKYLIQQNASVNVAANGGQTPLYLAASNGHLETVKYLKQKNAEVDARDDDGITPLMAAAGSGYLDTVKYLIQQNASVNATTNEGLTPLYSAALRGHLEIVKHLKQQNAEVDAKGKKGTTPLIGAAANGHLDTVKYLIQQNASVNAAANGGHTVIHLAASNGHLEIVKYLNQQNAEVGAKDDNGITPLMAAAVSGHLDIVKYLIQQGADVNAAASEGQTPLHYAALNGHLETVTYLKQKNAKVDAAAKDGATPLIRATCNGHLDVVKYLIQQNASVNVAANGGQTPLYLAASNGHLETVKYLKQKNAEVDARDDDGITPLMAAAGSGYLDTVKYLIQQNASVNATTNEGLTPLYSAALRGHLEIVKHLKQQNAEVDAKGKKGTTPLMGAAANGHLDTVKYLIQQNAKVNAAANGGHTVIHLAASNGHLEIVKYLKQKKAKVDAVDDNGITPLMAAAVSGHFDIVKYLIQQNADVNAAASEGQTPLHYAALNGHLKTVKYLIQQNANVNAAANNGLMAFQLAALNGHRETATYLKQQRR